MNVFVTGAPGAWQTRGAAPQLTSWRPTVPNAQEGWALIAQTVNGAPASSHVERNSAHV